MEVMSRSNSLIVTPHPVLLDGQRRLDAELVPGETLHAFLRRHVAEIDSGVWIVAIDGYQVPARMWERTWPKHGTVVECRSHVHKGLLQLAAVVALSYFTLGAGGIGGGSFLGLTGTIGYIAAGAAFMAGSMIINKMLAPKLPSTQQRQESPTYSLQGGSNSARPYEPIALLFGEMRIKPDYASLPYTFFEGENQILYSVFHAGINCQSVSQLKIGQTAIENFSGVSIRTAGIAGMPEQQLQGWGNVDAVSGADLKGAGAYVQRTSSPDAVALSIDVEATIYEISKSKGTIYEKNIALQADYRLVGSSDWLPFFQPGMPYFESAGVARLRSAKTKPLRVSFTLNVAQGQYEVRVRNLTADIDTTQTQSKATWTQMRSIQPDTGNYAGMGRLGLRITASGQLNGALDQLSWTATAKPMSYWNGSEWATATARGNGLSNPGAQLLLWARGIYAEDPATGEDRLIAGIGLDDSMIDIESLQGFMVRCASMGFRFDNWYDQGISCQEVADDIAASGMGVVTWQSGKFGVVWAAEDQPIGGVVNMATMRARTFSVSYQTADTADGIEYTYFDRNRDYTWQPIRVKDPNVPVALNPARITSVGVTEEAHAAILARFHLAQSLYQRKDIGYETDLEFLTYKRMSLLALTHDVTQWGFGGRLQSAELDSDGVLTAVLDDEIPANPGAQYIGLRIPGERGYRVFAVQEFSGTSKTIRLADVWPEDVPVPGGDVGNPVHDTIWIYDFKATPGYKVRVTSIEPSDGMSGASVAVVPEGPEFWDYVLNGNYAPPPSQSLLPFGLPVVSRLSITEQLQRQGASFYTDLTASFTVANAYARAEVWGATTGNAPTKLGETSLRYFTFRGGLEEQWTIEVRPFDSLGRIGSSRSITYQVKGLSVPPDQVTGVALTQQAVFFDEQDIPDLLGYEIRAIPGAEAKWSLGVPVHDGFVTDSPYTFVISLQGLQTIMVSAIDTSGNYGLPGYASLDFGLIDELNVAERIEFRALGWPGTIVNGSEEIVSEGTGPLVSDFDPLVDFWTIGSGDFWERDDIADFWGGDAYLAMSYVVRYAPAYGGGGVIVETQQNGLRPILTWRVDGGVTGDFWDPGFADFWSCRDDFWGGYGAWQPYIGSIPSVRNQGVQIRMSFDAGGQRSELREMNVRLQMPPLEQLFHDIEIDVGGTRLPPSDGMPALKWIRVEEASFTVFNDGSGAVVGRVLNFDNELGPLVEMLNASGVPVNAVGQSVRIKGF